MESEVPFALPDGWRWATVGSLLHGVEAGHSFRCTERPPEEYETGVVKVSSVTWGRYQEQESKTCVDERRIDERLLVRPGDFLFSRANTIELVGACVIAQSVTKRVMLSDKILRLTFDGVNQDWVLWALRTRWGRGEIERLATGNQLSMRNISQQSIRRIRIPLPPLAEQRRIVAAIEEQFTRLDAGEAALKRAQAALKRYRAAVLKAAVEGKLTAAWRSQHPDVHPASGLLADILTERRAGWEADLRAKGKDPAKAKYEEPQSPQSPQAEELPELPQGWVWATVVQVGEVQLGRQRAPQHHSGEYMRPYLRVANVFEDRIDVSDVLTMNFTPSEYETYRLRYGDILLNEGQSLELIGRPAMYRDEVPGACFQNTLVRFRAHAGVSAAFALIVFRAYLHSQRFQRIGKHTTNIAHLGAGRFAELEFPLPPQAEMDVIVADVEQRLSVVNVLEGTVAANLKRATRLRQAILERAFTGRLVPQDPADEPTSALLERIRQERGTATNERNRNGQPDSRPATVAASQRPLWD